MGSEYRQTEQTKMVEKLHMSEKIATFVMRNMKNNPKNSSQRG